MTTIAYNHKDKQIAYDSRSTMSGIVVTDSANKMIEAEGHKFFIAGNDGGVTDFIDVHMSMKVLKSHPECSAIVVCPENKVWLYVVGDDLLPRKSIIDYHHTMGSGELFALSAMDFGKSAAESVEYAKTRCIYTGGKVNIYNIEEGKVIK